MQNGMFLLEYQTKKSHIPWRYSCTKNLTYLSLIFSFDMLDLFIFRFNISLKLLFISLTCHLKAKFGLVIKFKHWILRKYKDSPLTFKSATFAAQTGNTYHEKKNNCFKNLRKFLNVGSQIFSEVWT